MVADVRGDDADAHVRARDRRRHADAGGLLPGAHQLRAQPPVGREQFAVVSILVREVERLLDAHRARRLLRSGGLAPALEGGQFPCERLAAGEQGRVILGHQGELGHDKTPARLREFPVELDRLAVAVKRAGRIAHALQRVAQIEMRLRHVRTPLEQRAVRGRRLLEPPILAQQFRCIEAGLREYWRQRDCLLVAAQRFAGLALVLQRIAEVVVGLGELRVALEGRAIGSNRLVQEALLAQHVAGVQMRHRQSRLERNGALAGGKRLLEPAGVRQCEAKTAVDFRHVRIQRERSLQRLDRLRRPAQGVERFAQAQVRLGERRVDG